MKLKNLVFLMAIVLGIGFCGEAWAQQSKPTVTVVESVGNKTVTVEGSLSDGVKLKSLAWAWSSSNACFPGTVAAKFTGNHVLFVTELPPRSVMTVTVKPKDDGTNLSLYGYQIGREKVILPEDLQYCVTCEADHERQYLRRGEVRTGTRTMRFNAIGNSYKVVIGVAGANNLTEGDFTLEIALKQ